MMSKFQCPNCSKINQVGLGENKVCTRCGWSDKEPKEDTSRGYW